MDHNGKGGAREGTHVVEICFRCVKTLAKNAHTHCGKNERTNVFALTDLMKPNPYKPCLNPIGYSIILGNRVHPLGDKRIDHCVSLVGSKVAIFTRTALLLRDSQYSNTPA
jgi:hypothetical protein